MKIIYKKMILFICVIFIGIITGCGDDINNPTTTEKPIYTKEQLERDPRAPSKDPADYNANGEYVPKNGLSRNPADYNAKGEYKPVDKMTQEEKRKELEDMLKRATK